MIKNINIFLEMIFENFGSKGIINQNLKIIKILFILII
jgi:hypothetical protein